MKTDDVLDNITDFLNQERIALMEHVCEDLDIHIDYELSRMHDLVSGEFIEKSFEEIITATILRISTAIQSYKGGL